MPEYIVKRVTRKLNMRLLTLLAFQPTYFLLNNNNYKAKMLTLANKRSLDTRSDNRLSFLGHLKSFFQGPEKYLSTWRGIFGYLELSHNILPIDDKAQFVKIFIVIFILKFLRKLHKLQI